MTVDLLKFLGQDSVERLMDLANICWRAKECRTIGERVNWYHVLQKIIGELKNIKLLEHGTKVIKRIFEKQLTKTAFLDEMQMRFLLGKGTVNAISWCDR